MTAAVAMSLGQNAASAATPDGDKEPERLDSVIVSASRAGKQTPVTYTMVSKTDLERTSPLNSLPMALGLQPSAVSVNEGGTGLGYSKLKVRGVSGSQTNVTLNGITLNDAESQEVFWVNIPALTSILSSVQMQRGLGTSANGAGAFGASLNMSTASVSPDPYATVEVSRGSYNTMMTTVSAGTGLTASGLYFSAAYSKNTTDGYLRNAFADVQSAFAALGWMKENNSLRFTWLMGDQRTGITWDGVSLADMENNRRYNSAGEYYDQWGNVQYYNNNTDNYSQNHFQLNYTHQFNSPLTWSTTLNYTKGFGFYEQYKVNKKFSAYGLSNPEIDGVVYKKGDFIINKSMDNTYLVLNSDLRYRTEKLNATAGVYLSRYSGDHFGDVLWSNILGDSYDYSDTQWYFNNGLKTEANVFARAEYQPIEWLTAYADLQFRHVGLDMTGVDDEFSDLTYNTTWNFFNPRAGLTFSWNPSNKAYVSAALGHREPGRSDIKEIIETNNAGSDREEMRPESMVDVEIGYEYSSSRFSASANVYLMEYKDMLLETGKLSNSGYAIKENVPRSWRRGIELAAAYKAVPGVLLGANATLSVNKIKEFTAYVDTYDADWNPLPQTKETFENTNILLSPSVIGAVTLTLSPEEWWGGRAWNGLNLNCDWKYVGRQYWDNTSCADRCIPSYNVMNASVSKAFGIGSGNLTVGLYVNNLLNSLYYADAWVYRAIVGGENYQEEGVFPQATRNAMLKVTVSF